MIICLLGSLSISMLTTEPINWPILLKITTNNSLISNHKCRVQGLSSYFVFIVDINIWLMHYIIFVISRFLHLIESKAHSHAVICRGVQYVHWVMHKCIMVKVGGKRNTRKVCKKQVNLCKTGGKICQSREGNNNFRETEGEMY